VAADKNQQVLVGPWAFSVNCCVVFVDQVGANLLERHEQQVIKSRSCQAVSAGQAEQIRLAPPAGIAAGISGAVTRESNAGRWTAQRPYMYKRTLTGPELTRNAGPISRNILGQCK
jgi:hypothetical protein